MQREQISSREQRDSLALAISIEAELGAARLSIDEMTKKLAEGGEHDPWPAIAVHRTALVLPVAESHLKSLGVFHGRVPEVIANAIALVNRLREFTPEIRPMMESVVTEMWHKSAIASKQAINECEDLLMAWRNHIRD